tara:strand:- start:60718 stop:61875 length:1158 start_codon:yes stop_codon:yes gene_type:complete
MQIPKKKQRRIEKVLEIAADVGSLAMSLRDRPTRLDWVSLGLRAVSIGIKIQHNKRKQSALCPWSYFEDTGPNREWVAIPESLGELILKHVRQVSLVKEYWDEDMTSELVCLGLLRGQEIGWLSSFDGKLQDGPYMRADKQEATHTALGTCLWDELGNNNLVFGTNGLTVDPLANTSDRAAAPELATAQFSELQGRIRSFLHDGQSRSLLFSGPPGTGKSTGVRQLARGLKLRTLRVEIKMLAESDRRGMQSLTASLDTLVRALAPEALILDDIDRVQEEDKLLHFLELTKRTCRLVLASANNLGDMTQATLRPGRFDEIIEVTKPDKNVVRALLGDDEALLEKIGHLPMAYIAEFVNRREALGREVAMEEIPQLLKRFNASKPD